MIPIILISRIKEEIKMKSIKDIFQLITQNIILHLYSTLKTMVL